MARTCVYVPNLRLSENESAVSKGYQMQILPSTVHEAWRRGTHASPLCQKPRQSAARVQEEPMPSLRENPAWQRITRTRGPGTSRTVRQIPLGESPSYERDAERQRRCEEGGTQESYETTRGVQSCTALTRGLCGAPGRQRETRAETTERIWEEVRKRTPLQTQKRKPSGNWRRGDQEIGTNRRGKLV